MQPTRPLEVPMFAEAFNNAKFDHCNGDDDDHHCNGDVDEGNNNDDNYMYHDDIYCGDFDIFATPSGRSIQYIYDDDYIDDDD